MKTLRTAIALLLVFVVLTGFVFPIAVWGIGQTIFPHQANGSLIKDPSGKVIGSELIGQNFTDPKYFHPRPSAAGSGYDAANSGGTNLGPTSDKLINGIKDDPTTEADETYHGIKDLAKNYRETNGIPPDAKLPADAVTRSASGLDPDISIANALLQAPRVAKARGLPTNTILALVKAQIKPRSLAIFGEPTVNVLRLNLEMNKIHPAN